MPSRATGTFAVKLAPLAPYNDAKEAMLGRLSIDKEFSGELSGTSKGEMLSAGTAVKGSAVYVAVEHVTATLAGRRGTFVLHHRGIMDRGTPQLTISVVPDSGTGELEGLAGSMSIDVAAGQHAYSFDYALPDRA